MEKAVLCYKVDQLIASLPSFRSVQSSLAVREFHAAGKNAANKVTDGCMQTFDVVAPKVHQNNRSYVCELSMQTYFRIHHARI